MAEEPEGRTVNPFSNCCYVCKHRDFLVRNYRSQCTLDKLFRASFGTCEKFEMTTDKERISAAKLVATGSEKWFM